MTRWTEHLLLKGGARNMGPEKRRFWLPLARLAAFFMTFVISINIALHILRPPAVSVPLQSQESDELSVRKQKRLERRITRALGWLRDAPPSVTPTWDEETSAQGSCLDPILKGMPEPGGLPPPGPEMKSFRSPVFESSPFVWPEAPELIRRSEALEPKALGFADWPEFRAGLVSDLYRRCDSDPTADVGDTVLLGPELIVDEFLSCIGSLSGRPFLRSSEDEENRSVTARMLDVQLDPRKQRLFTVFLQQWTEREMKYLSAFEDSRVNTFGFEIRTEGADLEELTLDQRKVLWDALRRTYLARYILHSEEQIRDGAWYIDRWTAVDFAVIPPFIGAYVYYRGVERKISMGQMGLRLSLEPLSEILPRKHDRPAAAALEWTLKGFPVGIIVSTGLYNGHFELDFAGVGTSIGAARGAVQGTYNERLR